MKCKNNLCYNFSEASEGNCSIWMDREIETCHAKVKYDKIALKAGFVEIEGAGE